MRFVRPTGLVFEIVPQAIRTHAGRAAAALVSISVSCALVVALGAVFHGLNVSIAAQLDSARGTVIRIKAQESSSRSACGNFHSACVPPLSLRDIFAEAQLIAMLPEVKAIVVRTDVGITARKTDGSLFDLNLRASTGAWASVGGESIVEGRDFEKNELGEGTPVALINSAFVTIYFGDLDPLGRHFEVGGQRFTVAGVFQNPPPVISEPDQPEAVITIRNALRAGLLTGRTFEYDVLPRERTVTGVTTDAIIEVLRVSRKLRPGQPNSFRVETNEDLVDVVQRIKELLIKLGFAIGLVGAVVGGVGIAAVMTISVAERSNEVGIRRAVGASRTAIRNQFLAEAVSISGFGAFLGMILGEAMVILLRHVAPFPVRASLMVAAMSAMLSVLVGVFAGLYPAVRASHLEVVEALRYE